MSYHFGRFLLFSSAILVLALGIATGQTAKTRNSSAVGQLPNQFVWDLGKDPVRESLLVAYGSIERQLEIMSTTDPSRGNAVDLHIALDSFMDSYDDFQFACLVWSNHADLSLSEKSKARALWKLERLKRGSQFFTKMSVLRSSDDRFLEDWSARTSTFCQQAYELALKVSVRLGLEQ
jgi:hypothetical protein